jgi:hypothetical protein
VSVGVVWEGCCGFGFAAEDVPVEVTMLLCYAQRPVGKWELWLYCW